MKRILHDLRNKLPRFLLASKIGHLWTDLMRIIE
jgi:hypothetical protein